MSFIELGDELGEAKEAELAPEGEYDLRCHDVEHVTKDGKNYLRIMIVIEGEENYAPFSHFVGLPKEDDERDTVSFKLLMLKRFLNAFSIPFEPNGFNPMDIKGASAKLGVVQEEYTPEGGEPRLNNVLRVPRLPEGT